MDESKTPEEMAEEFSKFDPATDIGSGVGIYRQGLFEGFLAGYNAAMALTKMPGHESWAIKTPNSQHVVNLLESSEALAWAKLYTIHTNSKHWVPPSRVPPDFIRGLKDIGYKAVRLMEAPNE